MKNSIRAILICAILSIASISASQDINKDSFCDFFNKNYTANILNRDLCYKMNYIKTDTIWGFEIRYYHFMNNEQNRCNEMVLFTEAISFDSTILDYSKNNLIHDQSLNSSPYQFSSNKVDTFYYTKNHNLYHHKRFVEFEYKNKLSGFLNKHKMYKQIDNEYFKIYKVYAIIDIFKGCDECNRRYHSYLEIDNYEECTYIFYRDVLIRQFYYPQKLFGISRQKYKKYSECHFIDYY